MQYVDHQKDPMLDPKTKKWVMKTERDILWQNTVK